jgi:hypothetical protein
MKKTYLFFLLLSLFSFSTLFAQIEGEWQIAPQAGALGVGPAQGDVSWWSNGIGDVTVRACLFDDKYVFNADGSFENIQDGETWLEPWQGTDPEACGAPIAPHDGSNAATWAYDETAGTITLTGVGAYLGLAKATNGAELSAPANAPASVTYTVTAISATQMTLDIGVGNGFWRFVMDKVVPPTTIDGVWQLAPEAGALGVGPARGDVAWFSNAIGDVTARACLFDDKYVFNADGSFENILDGETWLEPWQGTDPEACGTPVAPHDGSNPATWAYDETAGTLTLTGVGAHLGLAKAVNGSELSSPADAPASVTYLVTTLANDRMTIDIEIANGGFWRFILVKTSATTSIRKNVTPQFNFYPNPASTELVVNATQRIDQIAIRDLTGRTLTVVNNPATSERIDVSSFAKGMYLLESRSGNQVYTQKFLVQ